MEKILELLKKLKRLFVKEDSLWIDLLGDKNFNSIKFPFIKRVYPTLVSSNIVNTQPVMKPSTIGISSWAIAGPSVYSPYVPIFVQSGSAYIPSNFRSNDFKNMEVLSSDIKENIDRIKESITRSQV